MFYRLNRGSRSRGAWLTLALGALGLELIAYGLQYFLKLNPCVLCIYQRAAIAGVLLSALIGAIAPQTPLRLLAVAGWVASAATTLSLAWEQTMLQLHPPLFATCDFMARFPKWLPLDNWLPSFFTASGNCLDRSWTLLNLSMAQWLVGISGLFLLIGLLVAIAQLPRFGRR